MTRTAPLDVLGLADDLDRVAQLGAHAGAEHPVVVDQHHARRAVRRGAGRAAPGVGSSVTVALLGISSWTSVPSPSALRTWPAPPWRSIRPKTDWRRPEPVLGHGAGSNPGPRSRTNTVTWSGSTSA